MLAWCVHQPSIVACTEGWRGPAMIAGVGHIPVSGRPPCRERQVGESASPRLNALRSIDQNEPEIEILADDSIPYSEPSGAAHRSRLWRQVSPVAGTSFTQTDALDPTVQWASVLVLTLAENGAKARARASSNSGGPRTSVMAWRTSRQSDPSPF